MLTSTGRRRDPDKQTHLFSKIDDIRRGHQSSNLTQTAVVSSEHSHRAAKVKRTFIVHLSQFAIHHQHFGFHSPDLFPLTRDYLLPLVHYNVLRAATTNLFLLRETSIVDCNGDGNHPFRITPLPTPGRFPPSLEPTVLQQEVEHAEWMDVFPLAGLRDALIRAAGTFDESDLLSDFLGGILTKKIPASPNPRSKALRCSEVSIGSSDDHLTKRQAGAGPKENMGFIVWGDPFRVEAWEVSEGFLTKWSWLLKTGCDPLLISTNSHRNARGEDPIKWERWGIQCAE